MTPRGINDAGRRRVSTFVQSRAESTVLAAESEISTETLARGARRSDLALKALVLRIMREAR